MKLLCAQKVVVSAAAAAKKDDRLWDNLEHISIFARMTPELKEKILAELKARGIDNSIVT